MEFHRGAAPAALRIWREHAVISRRLESAGLRSRAGLEVKDVLVPSEIGKTVERTCHHNERVAHRGLGGYHPESRDATLESFP